MNNMKRMVWIAVAMLIMIGIMGFGLHTLNRITEVNKERREKDKGEAIVAKILETTVATNVWDKLRAKQDEEQPAPIEENAVETDANGNMIVIQTDENGNTVIQDMENGNVIVQTQVVPQNQDNPADAAPDSPEEDFTTVAVPIVAE